MKIGLVNFQLTRCLILPKFSLYKSKISQMASNTASPTEPVPTSSTGSEPQPKPFRKSRDHPEFGPRVEKKKRLQKEFELCHYHTENCLKFVKPYYYNATSFAKGRWYDRPIIDVITSEFTSNPREYYANAIVNGRLKLNDKKITNLDALIKNGDKISHMMHRHEPPILSKVIDILHRDEDLLVLNKPSSIPVHPSGRYHFNTLLYLMHIEYGFEEVFTIHRLDRLTSGIILLGLSPKASRRVSKLMAKREVTKEYVCIVRGKFPDEIYVNKPIECVSHQIGVCRISDDDDVGKFSETSFERLSYNGDRSLVRCMPKTGRMHQIRVHLQYLGFPIINDPIYNHPAWELAKYNAGVPPEKVEEMVKLLKDEISIQEDVHAPKLTADDEKCSNPKLETDPENVDSSKGATPAKLTHPDDHIMKHPLKYGNIDLSQTQLHAIYKKLNPTPDSVCIDCKSLKNIPHLCMYLHAISYKSCDWEFRTKLPDWANEFEFETKTSYKDYVNIVSK